MKSLYDISLRAIEGDPIDLSLFRDKPILFVNTASKCGLTPQYEAFEVMHQKYKDRGLVVIACPCNQFGGQEPGSEIEITKFCKEKYGISFIVSEKIEVNGQGQHGIFAYLKSHVSVGLNEPVSWNFTKFLVSPNATEILRYEPTINPHDMEPDIERFLPNQ